MSIGAEFWRDGNFSARKAKYRWDRPWSDEFLLELDYPEFHPPPTLDRFVSIVELILAWRVGRYLWCGDHNYWTKGHSLYDPDRLPAGWFCWVPSQVPPEIIPSAYRVGAFLDGTLIVTQREFFNINDNAAAIERANAVEYEMNEAGLLPLLRDLV